MEFCSERQTMAKGNHCWSPSCLFSLGMDVVGRIFQFLDCESLVILYYTSRYIQPLVKKIYFQKFALDDSSKKLDQWSKFACHVENLIINYFPGFWTDEGLQMFKSLKKLVLRDAAKAVDLRCLQKFTSLTSLVIVGFHNACGLPALPSLEELVIKCPPTGNTNWNFLSCYPNLKRLTLNQPNGNLSFDWKTVEYFDIIVPSTSRISSLEGMTKMVSLKSLSFSGNKLPSLKDLASMPKLQNVLLHGYDSTLSAQLVISEIKEMLQKRPDMIIKLVWNFQLVFSSTNPDN